MVAFLLVGFLFSLSVAAKTDQNLAVSAVATSEGLEFRLQDAEIGSFQVSVFAANGNKLFKSGRVNSGSVTWNLTNSSGKRVPFGIWLYQFVGKSSEGQVAEQSVGKIFIGPNQVVAESVGSKELSPMKGNGKGPDKDCTTIQSGEITYSEDHYLEDQPLMTGYDPYEYNYQAHIFKGSYVNVYLGRAGFPPYEGDDEEYLSQNPDAASHWAWPYRGIKLIMKWNDAWLSNKDCDGDGKLDRYYGHESYIGSGACLTNHMSGGQGKDKWTYFTKIVAVPSDAVLDGGVWYTADGEEIGPVIWGAFATIQEVESGLGATYVSPSGPGFGKWK